jgi:arylsulfatase
VINSESLKINRRDFLKLTSATSCALLMTGINCCTKKMARDKRPNILFLMADQFRGDYIGAAGAHWMHTPNLDRLVDEGALFTKAYSSTPSCLPARAALLTGMSPWGHGLLLYAPMAEKYPYEKPQIFRDAGYHTMGIGKMHFSPQRNTHGYHKTILEEGWHSAAQAKQEFKCDYQMWFEKTYPDKDMNATGLGYVDHRTKAFRYEDTLHPTFWTTSRAIEFLEHYEGEAPYLLKVSFQRPHPPFDPPQRWLDFYKDAQIPQAVVGKWSDVEYGKFIEQPHSDQQRNNPRGNFGQKIVRNSRLGYCAAVSFVDEQIGRLMNALEERGDLENTLILFTSDHGDMMGDHHLWRKTYAYEGSARIPMIIRWPESMKINIRRGQMMNELVELRDVLPTFLDAAGIDKPTEMEGSTMLELIRGNRKSWRRILDLEHGTCYWPENSWTALTDGRYKYIYFALTGEQQLFDLEQDPIEQNDLAVDPVFDVLIKEWRNRMIQHLSIRGEPWVMDGDLGIRKDTIKHGPNFPVKRGD